MPPDTVAGLTAFLLLAAPGVVYQLVRERRRPAWRESAFRETSRVVFASAVFTGLALGILALVRALWPSAMPDPGRWLRQGGAYVQANYRLVALALGLEALLAVGLAVSVSWLLGRQSPARLQRISAWYGIFREYVPEGTVPFVRVQLRNGDVYAGHVAHYSEDLALADRELVLEPPLTYRPSGADGGPLEQAWQRVSMPAAEISVMWVSYVRTPEEPHPS